MQRSSSSVFATFVAVFALSIGISAQTTFVSEDFSSASGSTPPAGWTQTSSGTAPIDWRYDDPNGLNFSGGLFAGNHAVADSDFGGSGTAGSSTLTSPVFDVSGAATVNLTFDHCLNYLSGESAVVEVWDGIAWNAVATYTSDQGSGVTFSGGGEVPVVADVTAAAGGHNAAQLRFAYLTYTWDYWWAIDNVDVLEPAALDVEAVSIDSLSANYVGDCQTPVNASAEIVTFTVRNKGVNTLLAGTSIPSRLFLDSVQVAQEPLTLAADLLPNATVQLTFAATLDLTVPGPHVIDVQTNLPGDGNPANNIATFNSTTTVLLPEVAGWLEDFESHATSTGSTDVPLGWVNDQNDDGSVNGASHPDWKNEQGTTPSGSSSGPSVDHTTGLGTGWYMHIEDSSGTDSIAINLITPCLDPSGVNVNLTFWNWSEPSDPLDDNLLEIDVIDVTNGGTVTMSVAAFASNPDGTGWVKRQVDLSAYAGSIIRCVFRGRNDNGDFNDDEAIDDVGLESIVFDTGQAPQAGLAEFDIDGAALNLLGNGIGSGQPGPYFVDIVQGGQTVFQWTSLPNQAATCFFANLNRASATFPGVGQTDVGVGPLDPIGGYPQDIVAFGDGIAWYTNPGQPFNFDTLWISDAAGNGTVGFLMPPLSAPGSILTTFQVLCLDPNAPFFHLSNAIEVTLQ